MQIGCICLHEHKNGEREIKKQTVGLAHCILSLEQNPGSGTDWWTLDKLNNHLVVFLRMGKAISNGCFLLGGFLLGTTASVLHLHKHSLRVFLAFFLALGAQPHVMTQGLRTILPGLCFYFIDLKNKRQR